MFKMLIVEDNHNYRRIFKDNLYRLFPSAVIEEAATGEVALEKINVDPPHCIFMDIRLPGVNGLQLTKKIKKAYPSINICILTSYNLPEYQRAAIENGADLFLVKDSLKWDKLEAFLKPISPNKV